MVGNSTCYRNVEERRVSKEKTEESSDVAVTGSTGSDLIQDYTINTPSLITVSAPVYLAHNLSTTFLNYI